LKQKPLFAPPVELIKIRPAGFAKNDPGRKLRILIKSATVLFQFGHYSDEFGHVQKLAALG